MTDEAKKRKQTPVFSGVLNYFPDAIRAVSEVSFVGNEQHNPGKPLHWDRSKSQDELDALTRHLIDAGTLDSDGIRHSAKVAWRALANLQKEIENEKNAIQSSNLPNFRHHLDGTYTDADTGETFDVPQHSQFPNKDGLHPREAREERVKRYREELEGSHTFSMVDGATVTIDTPYNVNKGFTDEFKEAWALNSHPLQD